MNNEWCGVMIKTDRRDISKATFKYMYRNVRVSSKIASSIMKDKIMDMAAFGACVISTDEIAKELNCFEQKIGER